ncbi:MAG: Clp protease ClpS [Bacteroidetes bacterium 24-39-8]|jgi:ATP-dependent Clp protease adaptor protein ClpS|nr:MAG: Clp protease ClpS [Sphingobacteriia bacterium 35-40-8]OYZ47383.1 MAG: Clp protease ClpS [Bacteroidetes bacterium 24-39-8]OZA67033.1 MAG: Clp protease ClpS [Sphingobacteriia bacterium 39-39-8]HQR93841.1 ATP-dependent Clp protease adaptor ClpS [Sediminibacterium sp.]HQS54140.1 ATP-dependent Clp protease adaptor ClpS [Sediminibacterium sp.]
MHLFGQQEAAQPREDSDVGVLTLLTPSYSLIVWNDEVNSFDWVIETLMEVCGHDLEQAEQCAMIIHNKGKYAVKNGDYDTLKPMCDAITDRGIGATIEVIA